MKRSKLNVFSLSFLDIITCGLGAVILLFVLVNAQSAARRNTVVSELRARTNRMQQQVLDGKKQLVEVRNRLEKIQAAVKKTRGRFRQVIELLRQKKVELADRDQDTLASRAHVNQLKADLKSLEEDVRRLRAGARAADELGDRLQAFPGHGDRQYLTDLKMGGRRILVLVDASASMLDETIVGAIRRRNLPLKEKITAPKWRQVVATVDWLTAQLPPASQFQIYRFNETAAPLIAGSGKTWLSAGKVENLKAVVARMHQLEPQKGTSLINGFAAAAGMKPAPDNIFLLTDSLPTMGAKKPWSKRVSGAKRLRLFKEAVGRLPARVPVNIILYPMEGDPMAADAFWRLAKETRGSFFCPSKDWP